MDKDKAIIVHMITETVETTMEGSSINWARKHPCLEFDDNRTDLISIYCELIIRIVYQRIIYKILTFKFTEY